MKRFNWNLNTCHNPENKRSFHATARSRLRMVAKLMGLAPGTYDIRSNAGGPAVSGEITLHTDRVYVQVAQSCMGENGILVRECKSRKDYTGGRNRFALLPMLNNPEILAAYAIDTQRRD